YSLHFHYSSPDLPNMSEAYLLLIALIKRDLLRAGFRKEQVEKYRSIIQITSTRHFEFRFNHLPPREFLTKYIGLLRRNNSSNLIKILAKDLDPSEFEVVRSRIFFSPKWMKDLFEKEFEKDLNQKAAQLEPNSPEFETLLSQYFRSSYQISVTLRKIFS